jgi:aflatoxin B1 aldehyde reductase
LNEKAELLTAMQKFVDKVSEKGLTPTEVSLRWLAHHSALREHDGMIVGASRVVQIVDTVDLISKGKLENEVVELVEELWKGAESAHLELLWGNGMD